MVGSLDFRTDGRALAVAGSDPAVRIWEVDTGLLWRRLEGHTATVTTVRFSPDGHTLATGSEDQTVRLWDVVRNLERQRLDGHTQAVWGVSFSPDGRMLASAGGDQTVYLWDLSTGQIRQRLEVPASVWGMQFSPRGDALVTGSWDGAVRWYAGATWQPAWVASVGQRGTWLICHHTDQRCWRYDDGTFLQRLDATGDLTPVAPPPPAEPGHLTLPTPPAPLVVADGEATSFTLTLHNSGPGNVYWVQVRQDPQQPTPFTLRAPPASVVVEPGAVVHLPCTVFAATERHHPQGRQVVLPLQITAVHAAPLPIALPVTIRAPSLEVVQAQQTADKRLWHITVRNTGEQDAADLTLQAQFPAFPLATVEQGQIRAHDTVVLSFAIPAALLPKKMQPTLTATQHQHPVHVWEFATAPIARPISTPGYVLGAGLGALGVLGAYYLHRRYRS